MPISNNLSGAVMNHHHNEAEDTSSRQQRDQTIEPSDTSSTVNQKFLTEVVRQKKAWTDSIRARMMVLIFAPSSQHLLNRTHIPLVLF